MLLSSIFVIPNVVHAGTGTVSVNGGSQIAVAQTATTVSVPIQISGSDALNGFDVQVTADPHFLQGASVDISGSLLTSPRIVLECINGILVTGNSCAPQDAAGVVHFAAVQLGFMTTAPTSGLLFTINYNIVGNTGGITIGFNPGCSGTSIASGDCVTISNGTPTPLSETDLGANFANLNDFKMTPDFLAISAPVSTTITDKITYVALGLFNDVVNEAATGTQCTFTSGTASVTIPPTASDTLSCMSATAGDFNINVTATGLFSLVTHSKVIKLHVGPAGFSSTVKPASITVPAGTSDSSAVATFKGVSGFSGMVTASPTSPSGITATANPPTVTLTNDGSGNSVATTTLTVSVAGTTASGTYAVSINGGGSLSVIVPTRDFTISPTIIQQSVPRGGGAVQTYTITSTGSFAGTVTLSATVTANGLDAGTGVNNIVSTFTPSTVTLTPGGSATVGYVASTVKIGDSPNPANTATGNYTATINAASSSTSPHTATIAFNVFDFSLGPNFCAGNTKLIFTSPNTFFNPVSVGGQCDSFTLTTQTVKQGGSQSTLWMQVNPLGGIQTFGVEATGTVAAVNPNGPGRGTRVPYLHRNVCFFQEFWPNGTEISRSYLVSNGPIVRAGPFGGCRFSFAYAVPHDVEATPCIPPDNPSLLDCVAQNNVDFLAITADSLPTTLPGTYGVRVCGLYGTLLNCQIVNLIVVQAPVVTGFIWTHGAISVSHGGHFQLTVTNTDTQSLFTQVSITGTAANGDTFTVSSVTNGLAPGTSQAYNLFQPFTTGQIGETFVFTTTILVSPFSKGADAVDNVNGTTSAGTSTLSSVSATFTVGP